MSASGPSERRCLCLVSFLKRTKICIMSTLKSKSFIAARCFVLFFIVLNLCPHPGRAPDSLYLHHSIYTYWPSAALALFFLHYIPTWTTVRTYYGWFLSWSAFVWLQVMQARLHDLFITSKEFNFKCPCEVLKKKRKQRMTFTVW